MSLHFQSLNYPSNISCCISKHTSQSQGRKNPSLVKLPSSIIPQAVESSLINKPSSGRTFSSFQLTGQEANGIGIIGGVSAYSSLNFAKKLVNFKLEEEESSLPFVLCSDPVLSKELLFFERGSLPFFSAKTCDVSHSWYDEIEEGCSVPFLHVGECVAKELKEAKLRPLEAGSPLRIGVLATNETLVARFYREKLENEGFEVILPDKATVEHTVIPAVEALNRKDVEGAQNLFRIALQVLLVRAVNRVILASDELRQLLPPDDPLWRKCIDPMDALARSSIKYAQSQGRHK